jgi:hypothetical protein
MLSKGKFWLLEIFQLIPQAQFQIVEFEDSMN